MAPTMIPMIPMLPMPPSEEYERMGEIEQPVLHTPGALDEYRHFLAREEAMSDAARRTMESHAAQNARYSVSTSNDAGINPNYRPPVHDWRVSQRTSRESERLRENDPLAGKDLAAAIIGHAFNIGPLWEGQGFKTPDPIDALRVYTTPKTELPPAVLLVRHEWFALAQIAAGALIGGFCAFAMLLYLVHAAMAAMGVFGR